MRFHETNDISWNFSGITLDFREIAMYFVDFGFRFLYFWKMTAKFWFLLNRFEILKFRTCRWQKLKKSISQLPNRSAHIRHLCRITTLKLPQMSNKHWCWKNEQHLNIDCCNFDHQMSLSKIKCCYSNNCLHF